MMGGRFVVILAGLTGFTRVVLAAIGAHAVPGMDDPANYRAWQSASLLHLVHSLVLLMVGIRLQQAPSRGLVLAAGMLFLGIVLFSGSIYARVALGIESTFNLAPTGGLLLMVAWLVMVFGWLRD